MEEKQIFHDRYELQKLLGRGNFSEVWLAKDNKTKISVALKIYAPATGLDDTGLDVFAREFSLVVNANHKNLLKPLYYDTYERKPYLVLPFCKNGSILKHLGNFTEEEAWKLLRDVADGLAYLHAMDPPIIHQDIKPDNIMMGDNGDYQITDFGVSSHVRSTLRRSLSLAFASAGTIAYMAPERFGRDNAPIMANDIYSLGATTFEMLTGDTPFGDDGGILQKKGAEVPALKGDYSNDLCTVIDLCLRADSWERPTAEQLRQYAEDHINGKKLNFKGEKKKKKKKVKKEKPQTVTQEVKATNNTQKPKKGGKIKYIVSTIAAAVVITTIALLWPKEDSSKQKAQTNDPVPTKPKVNIDSLRQVTAELVDSAKLQIAIGDAKGTNYEDGYIIALELLNQSQDILPADSVAQMIHYTDSMLDDAYKKLIVKAELFGDDPENSKAFMERANKAKDAIDKYKDK